MSFFGRLNDFDFSHWYEDLTNLICKFVGEFETIDMITIEFIHKKSINVNNDAYNSGILLTTCLDEEKKYLLTNFQNIIWDQKYKTKGQNTCNTKTKFNKMNLDQTLDPWAFFDEWKLIE